MEIDSSQLEIRELAINVGFAEGPIYHSNGTIIFVSIDHGRAYVIDGDRLSVLTSTGGYPNGAAEGADGSIYLAMSGGSFPGRPYTSQPGGVAVIRPSGRFEWLTLDPVAPNDLCFGPDGFLYVTDPTRGTPTDGRVWRIDTETGAGSILASVPWFPNGIGFGLRPECLYIADSANAKIVRWTLGSEGEIEAEQVVVEMDHGRPDGFAFDVDDNLIIAAPSSPGTGLPSDIQVWSPSGTLIDSVTPGDKQSYTNVALSQDCRLLVTEAGSIDQARAGRESGGSVLLIEGWPTAGQPLYPFRGSA